MLGIGEAVSSALDLGNSIIERVFPDPKDQAKAKQALAELDQKGQLADLDARMQIVKAEVQGESWLQRNWRPILMLSIVTIIANNYILAPYLSALFGIGIQLTLPDRLYDLLSVGLGGYIASKGLSDVALAWKHGQKE